jgi:hypothetical protein
LGFVVALLMIAMGLTLLILAMVFLAVVLCAFAMAQAMCERDWDENDVMAALLAPGISLLEYGTSTISFVVSGVPDATPAILAPPAP